MTEGTTPTPRFDPSRAEARRIRIDTSKSGSGKSSFAPWAAVGLLVVGGAAAALWAHQQGHVELPFVNELLAKTRLELPGFGGAPSQRLLEAGEEPRQTLRYGWQEGTVAERVVTVEVDRTLTLAGAAQPATTAALRAGVTATLGGATSSGDRLWTLELTSLEAVSPSGAAATPAPDLVAQLDPAREGFRGTLQVDARGQILQSRLEFPASSPELQPLLDLLLQTLALTFPALPEEPVGRGARWRTSLDAVGADARLEAEHLLAGVDAAGATIESSLSSGADLPTSVSVPELPEDHGELVGFVASGTLTRQLDLAGIVTTLTRESTVEARFAPTAEAGSEEGAAAETVVVTTCRATLE